MALIGVIPGMPNLAFLSLAALAGGGAWWLMKQKKVAASAPAAPAAQEEAPARPPELGWDDVQQVDTLGLEIGYRLIPMVDTAQGGQLLERIKGVRRKLSQELGFLVPSVHIRDNLDLGANQYRISMMGVTLGSGDIYPDRDLAINSGQVYGDLNGIATKDPTFGLDAVWINKQDRDQAQTLGYTVVDAGTVIATHLSQILQDNADELLGLEEVQQLLDRMKASAPKLVDEVTGTVTMTTIVQVLQNLLREHVPIRDMRTILEAMLERSGQTKDPTQLTVHVRTALGKFILQNIPGVEDIVEVMTLDPNLEQILLKSMQGAPEGQLAIEPSLAEKLSQSLGAQVQAREMEGKAAILLVNPFVRSPLARLFRYSLPSLVVLSYSEVPESRQINVFAAIG
jgi:flagellar biosynthesis protein FlhA